MATLAIGAIFGLGVICLFDFIARPAHRIQLRSMLSDRAPGFACAISVGAASYAVTDWPMAGLAGAIAGGLAPGMITSARHRRRALARREAIAELAARLRDSVRAGIGLSDALVSAGPGVAPAIAADVARLVSGAQISGLSAAADEFAASVGDPCAAMFAAALRLADTLGSRSLSDVLDSLASSAAAEAATVKEAQARQASARTSARVISAVPVLLLLAIRHVNPAYVAPLGTSAGQAVLGLACLMVGAGYMVMRRLGAIEVDA